MHDGSHISDTSFELFDLEKNKINQVNTLMINK